MNALYLLSLLKGLNMATTVTTPSGHPAVALLDQPNGSQEDLILFSDKYIEERLKSHLMTAREMLGVS